MTSEEKKRELALLRLTQAEESIEEALFLLQGEKSLRSVVNRAYYAMFYAVLALLVFEPYSSSKHSGVISYFNKRFIREGVFSQKLGKSFQNAFKLRNSGDYQESTVLSKEEVTSLLDDSTLFVSEIRQFIENRL
jgi:uncharacterized protein (UPF0332 family)